MKTHLRFYGFLAISLLFASGCSAFPGLRVLSGQISGGQDAAAENVVEITDLVMADKSGLTDPALGAAADRIEAANNGNVDIIEIRKDLKDDMFVVYMLIRPPTQTTTQTDYVNGIRRAIELTWQGTMSQSQGSDILKVVILDPAQVSTLDKGNSFIGAVFLTSEISRTDAIAYLNHRPNSMTDFSDLIATGKLTVDQPTSFELYEGQPNHPVFMLSALAAQAQSQQGQ